MNVVTKTFVPYEPFDLDIILKNTKRLKNNSNCNIKQCLQHNLRKDIVIWYLKLKVSPIRNAFVCMYKLYFMTVKPGYIIVISPRAVSWINKVKMEFCWNHNIAIIPLHLTNECWALWPFGPKCDVNIWIYPCPVQINI